MGKRREVGWANTRYAFPTAQNFENSQIDVGDVNGDGCGDVVAGGLNVGAVVFLGVCR